MIYNRRHQTTVTLKNKIIEKVLRGRKKDESETFGASSDLMVPKKFEGDDEDEDYDMY
jgi:hypothetical protein